MKKILLLIAVALIIITTLFIPGGKYDIKAASGSMSFNVGINKAQAVFNPPTDFTITDQGSISITGNWTPGLGAFYTMIRALRGEYPTTPDAGELVYYGDGISFNGTGYALDVSRYCFSAWGYLADNVTYTHTYSTAEIGGDNMDTIGTELANMVALATTYLPILIQLFLLAGITALAYKGQDKIMYYLAGILVLLYGIGYWGTSETFSIALAVIGLAIGGKGVTLKKER